MSIQDDRRDLLRAESAALRNAEGPAYSDSRRAYYSAKARREEFDAAHPEIAAGMDAAAEERRKEKIKADYNSLSDFSKGGF